MDKNEKRNLIASGLVVQKLVNIGFGSARVTLPLHLNERFIAFNVPMLLVPVVRKCVKFYPWLGQIVSQISTSRNVRNPVLI